MFDVNFLISSVVFTAAGTVVICGLYQCINWCDDLFESKKVKDSMPPVFHKLDEPDVEVAKPSFDSNPIPVVDLDNLDKNEAGIRVTVLDRIEPAKPVEPLMFSLGAKGFEDAHNNFETQKRPNKKKAKT